MMLRTICIMAIAVVILLQPGCQSPTEPTGGGGGTKASTISGRVIRDDNNQPIQGAIVIDKGTIGAIDTSKADGSYTLRFDLSSKYSTTVFTTALGFFGDSTSVSVDPGQSTTLTVRMKRDSSVKVIGVLGPAATIVQVGLDASNISLRGTGQNQSALLTFEVRDSLGNPLVGANSVNVKFSLLGGPGGGEYLFPTSATTDPMSGRVSTRVTSGTKAGVLQVNASCRNDSVRSSPVKITISGGLPDATHFSLSREKANVAGMLYDGLKVRFGVLLGDRFGNPAQPSAIYFTSTGGIITASALSGASGEASVELTTTNPRPLGGIVYVTATTIGDTSVRLSDSTISRTIPVLFTGATQVIIPTTPLLMPDSGEINFSYRVMDPNGFPLVGGSEIKVSVAGPGASGLTLKGDVDVKIPDTDDTTYTRFRVYIDKTTRGGNGGPFTVVIDVKSDVSSSGNGTVTNDKLLGYTQPGGTTGGGGGTGGFPTPASIEFLSASRTSLTVNEGGSDQASLATLTFVVKDSAGNPIINFANSGIPRTIVLFSLPGGGLGGGEYLEPSIDSTNNSGRISTVFHAGTKSGPIRVQAKMLNSAKPPAYADLVISGGYPEANNITVGISKKNVPGLVKAGQLTTVNLQLADQYRNPARQGTVIYFTTSGGQIQASTSSDVSGQATAVLYGGAPVPVDALKGPGFGTITAFTYGRDSTLIQKTISFLFSGAPKIVLPASGFQIPDSGSYSFSFKVSDANGNPLASGNNITVSLSGAAQQDLTLTGDVSVTMGDTQDTSATNFSVTVSDKKSGGLSGPVSIIVNVSGDNGSASAAFGGTLLASGVVPSGGVVGGYPSSIRLVNAPPDPQKISVKGTGLTETVKLTFEVKDSLGNPISLARKAWVRFSIVGGPGGGEFVYPDSAETDQNGTVSVTVNAGTKAGVMQVLASYAGGLVKSAPVQVIIASGLADPAHFTAWADRKNYAGQMNGEIGRIFGQVGDRYGNPVQPNTAVYFTTNAGVIEAAGYTDLDGQFGVRRFGGNPFPVGGVDSVIVTTIGEGGAVITKTLTTSIFSGVPSVTVPSVPTDTIVVFDGASFDVDYYIRDANNNPLAAGNTVTVTASGVAASGVVLSGQTSATTADTRNQTDTKYTFHIADAVPEGGASGGFLVTISVSGPNGTAVKKLIGDLRAPAQITPPSPTVRQPAQIAFVSVSANDIFVAGVGALENSVITYEVRDSLGAPIPSTPRYGATFTLSFFPNTYASSGLNATPRVIPATDSTDTQAKLRASIQSGTQAGVVQLVARIDLGGGKIIQSMPVKITVHAGFPDQKHFTLLLQQYNFPGVPPRLQQDLKPQWQWVAVQVADRYSNPVEAGTAVYFNTTHGAIETGNQAGTTDASGFVLKKLYAGNPLPLGSDTLSAGPGWTYVYVRTLGQGSAWVVDSALVLWTGRPLIANVTGPTSAAIPNGGSAGPWTFTITDMYGHPLSPGTKIEVKGEGLTLAGNIPSDGLTLPDTQVGGNGLTDFTVTALDADPTTTIVPPKVTTLTLIVTHPIFGTYSVKLADLTVQ